MNSYAVMYHYVREKNGMNGITPLSPAHFDQQIKIIRETHRIISVEEIHKQKDGAWCVLTFDDGTKDQYEVAYKKLKEIGLPAYFAVMSGPHLTGEIPLVHLVHIVMSRKTDEELWDMLTGVTSIRNVEEESLRMYHYEENKYRRQLKYALNFILDHSVAREFLYNVFKTIYPDNQKYIEEFYVSDAELIDMKNNGMTIGVHGNQHLPYSGDAQKYYKEEIEVCKLYLENLLQSKVEWYTPPFGGGNLREQMIQDLTPILREKGFVGGFTTKHGFITKEKTFWMDRLDCTALPPISKS